jgi:acyl-CoA synthetase (AMP-forming)/AMP-acid ligase II
MKVRTHRGDAIAVTVPNRIPANAASGGGPKHPLEARSHYVSAVPLPLTRHAETVLVLARRGMFRPVRPDRLVRAGLAFRRWGTSPAAAYVVNAIVDADRVAVIGDDRAVTYAQLDRRTNSLARALAEAGAGPDRKLAILCRNGPTFVESVVTAAKLGADPLPLNTSFSAAEVAAVLEREQPPVIVFEEELAGLLDQVPAGAPIARIVAGPGDDSAVGRSYERLATTGPADPPEPPADEGRMVILTSGTTGTPKGARLGRPGGLDPLAWFLRVVPLNAGSVVMIPAPLFHAHGYGQLVVAAAMGSSIVLPSRFDPERTLELIERHRVSSMAVVPVMLKRIMDLPPETRRRYDTSSLRAVVASGSALEPELARAFMDAFGPVLYNLYGSTEMGFAAIATPRDMLEAPGTVGKPVPNTRVVLLDEQGRPVPTGEIGRIFVGSELMFDGYTDESASRDMAEGMMTVGDLGHMDSEGRLFVDAREDDMIVSGGENVYPAEVEAVLRRHEGVSEVVVVGVDDERFGQRLVGFAVPTSGSDLSTGQLDAFARENLARFKVPREFRLLDELPRNATGKVLRRKLKEEASSK